MTIFYGSALGSSVEELIEQNILDFIPPSWRKEKSQIYWAQEILRRRNSLLNIFLNCKVVFLEKEFLKISKKNKYYGMHWFFAQQRRNDLAVYNELPCPKDVIIGINDNGLFLFSIKKELLYNFDFNNISQVRNFPSSLSFICFNHFNKGKYFKVKPDPLDISFSTNQSEVIYECFESHINAIMKEYSNIPIEMFAQKIDKEQENHQFNFKGWLLKPDFKRQQQLVIKSNTSDSYLNKNVFESIIDNASIFANNAISLGTDMFASNFFKFSNDDFNLRWFSMNSLKGELNYFENDSEDNLRGKVFLKDIKSLQYSILQDVPIYSLDLVSDDKYYTITCLNRNDMQRWASVLLQEINSINSQSSIRITESLPTFKVSAFLSNGKCILQDLPLGINAKVSKLLDICLEHLEIKDKRKKSLGLFIYYEGYNVNHDSNSNNDECSDLKITPNPLSNEDDLFEMIKNQNSTSRNFKIVLKRKFFLPYSISDPQNPYDFNYVSVLYIQAFNDVVISNSIHVSSEVEILNLTCIAMTIFYGDALGNSVEELTEQNITMFIPEGWLKKKSIQYWCNSILQIKYQENTRIITLKKEYIDIVSGCKFYGMHLFNTHNNPIIGGFNDNINQLPLPSDVIIGINSDGVTLFDSSYTVLYELSYYNLKSWTHRNNKIILNSNYQDEDRQIVLFGSLKTFQICLLTTQSQFISDLITDTVKDTMMSYKDIPIDKLVTDLYKDLEKRNPNSQHLINFKGSTLLSIYLSVYVSIYLIIYLYMYLNMYLSIQYLSINLSIFKGWLAKPDYKRQQQLVINTDSTTSSAASDNLMKADTTVKWFSMNSSKRELNYFEDDSEKHLKGKISFRSITKVQYSILKDVPRFSLDLVSTDLYYTIICRTYSDMVSIYLSIYLSICLYIYCSIYLLLYLSNALSIYCR
jgi:hypothetical protein